MNFPPALRHRDFRLFMAGYLSGETGEYIHFVVQNWMVWELTHSAFYLGLIGFFEFTPRLIVGPIGGVIADRLDRRKLILISGALNFLQTLLFGFLIFAGWIQYWHIAALVVFMAIVSSVKTAAQTVYVLSLVPQEAVVSSLALHSATHSLTKIIGPSVGGVLLTLIGPAPCLLIHGLSILGMLGTILRLPQPKSSAVKKKGEWVTEIVEGFTYLRENRRVLVTILTAYSNGFFGISYSRFLPYFAEQVLHVGPSGYGLLVSAPGAGAVGVSFLLSTHTKVRGMRRLLLAASLLYACGILAFALSSHFLLSLLLLALIGATQMSYRVLARAIIQEECPDHLLGRAMSLFFLDRGFGSLGSVCVGAVAALASVPFAVAGGAILSGLGAWALPRILAREKAAAGSV